MPLEETNDFSGYEPTTVDPGWTATIAVVCGCTLVNFSLPILVKLARTWDQHHQKKMTDSHDSQENQEKTFSCQQLSENVKHDFNQAAPMKGPPSMGQLAPKSTNNNVGSECHEAAPFALPEGTSTICSTKELILPIGIPSPQSVSYQFTDKSNHQIEHVQVPRQGPDADDNKSSTSRDSVVIGILSHDGVSVQETEDPQDRQEGQGTVATNSMPLVDDDEPPGFLQQFLEVCDWDSESRQLVALTMPYTIQGCTKGVFLTINVAITGHYLGVMEANAYIMVSNLLEFSQTIAHGCCEAVGTLVPHAKGSGNDRLAGQYLQLSIILYTIMSIPSVVLWSFSMYPAVLWFGFDNETASMAQQFTYPFLLNAFMTGLDHGIYEFLNVTGHERYSTIVRIANHGAQTVFVIVLVTLGVRNLFSLGLVLALLGLIMTFANFIFVVHCGWMNIYWGGLTQKLSLEDSQALRTVLKTAIPMSLAWLLTYGEWEVLTVFARVMGPAEVAAWGMLGSIWNIFENLTAGFADAAECRVGYHLGAGHPRCAKLAAYKSLYLGVVLAILSSSGLFIVSAYLPKWLTPDPTLQSMIFQCLPLIGFGQILLIAGTIAWGSVSAQGRIQLATTVSFVSSWFVAIPLSAISLYVFNFNLLGFVASMIWSYAIGGVAMGFIILRSDWNKLTQAVIACNAPAGFPLRNQE